VAKFQDHQRRAAECLRLAREATDKTNKALLIEMAQTWAKLAEQDQARSEDEKPEYSRGPSRSLHLGAAALCVPPP